MVVMCLSAHDMQASLCSPWISSAPSFKGRSKKTASKYFINLGPPSAGAAFIHVPPSYGCPAFFTLIVFLAWASLPLFIGVFSQCSLARPRPVKYVLPAPPAAARCLHPFCRQDNVRSFGDLDERDIGRITNRCLGRMQTWCTLTKAVCKAEFPDFDIIKSFSIFSLAKERKDLRSTSAAVGEAVQAEEMGTRRLALLLKLDADNLLRELRDHRPIARKIFLDTSCSTFDAWKGAINRTQSKRSVADNHPAGQLKLLIIAFGCMGASSSGVEQGFSKALKNIGPQQASAGAVSEHHLTKLILDKDTIEKTGVATMLENAQWIWSDSYGEPRTSPSTARLDTGLKKNKATESGDDEENEIYEIQSPKQPKDTWI